MENKMKKTLKIVSIVGLSLALFYALIIPMSELLGIEFLYDIMPYFDLAIALVLLGAVILTIWLVDGIYNKITQIVLSAGALAYFVYKLLHFTILMDLGDGIGINIAEYLFIALFAVGGIMCIISLCVPKLRTKAIAPYALGFTSLMFALGPILVLLFGIEGIIADDAFITMFLKTTIILASTLFIALEYKNEDSKKPLFVYGTLLFALVNLVMYFTAYIYA